MCAIECNNLCFDVCVWKKFSERLGHCHFYPFRLTCIRPLDGVVMPHSVDVYAMVIESEMLLQDSLVLNNDSTCGYTITTFINDFQVNEARPISLLLLEQYRITKILSHFSLLNPFLNRLCFD